MRRVVVTGLGLVTPLGVGVDYVWSKLIQGESGIDHISSFDTSDLPCKIAGFISHNNQDEFFYDQSTDDLSDPGTTTKSLVNVGLAYQY